LERGFDYRVAALTLEKFEESSRRVRDAATGAHNWQDGGLYKRLQRDLLRDLTREYLATLGRMPSANRDSAFGQFANELTKHILPEETRFDFGHHLLKSAVDALSPVVVDPVSGLVNADNDPF
jgi:hypothetical protein